MTIEIRKDGKLVGLLVDGKIQTENSELAALWQDWEENGIPTLGPSSAGEMADAIVREPVSVFSDEEIAGALEDNGFEV